MINVNQMIANKKKYSLLNSQEVAKRLLEEAHVLMIPGNPFGPNGQGYIRIAATVRVEHIDGAFDVWPR